MNGQRVEFGREGEQQEGDETKGCGDRIIAAEPEGGASAVAGLPGGGESSALGKRQKREMNGHRARDKNGQTLLL